MKKRKKLILGGGVVVAIVLIGAMLAARGDEGRAVRVEVVGRRDLVSVVSASGYIQPKLKVDISADISGRVTALYVEEGQWVDEGDVLLRIDPTTFEANVQRATASVAQVRAQAAQTRANLLRAEAELARAERLAPQNLIAGAELEEIRTQVVVARAQMEASEHAVAQAEAGLAEAREQLRKTTIVAPMSGRVTRLNIRQGETAIIGTMNNPGSLLLTIADLTEMEARVRVGETDIPSVKVGDSATVRIDAYPDKAFTGRVTRIANSAVNAPSTRNQSSSATQQAQAIDFEVIVAIDDPSAELRPDLTATADIITAQRKQVLTVPIIAVTVRDAEGKRFQMGAEGGNPEETPEEVEGVFVFRDGVAEWTPVEVGIVGDWYFEVISGLSGGESVIAGPYATIRELEDGQQVRLERSAAAESGPAS